MANPILSKKQLTKCRLGQNEDTCAFIVASPDGIECARMDITISTAIFKRINSGTMTAMGEGGWPGCLWENKLNQPGNNL